MQLNQANKHQKSQVRKALGLVTANLFIATGAHAGTTLPMPVQLPASPLGDASGGLNDEPAASLGTTTLDSSVLFYQEQGGRVRAIEPVTRLNIINSNGDSFSAKLTFDSLTGASPNGAVPSNEVQTFTTPAAAPGHQVTVTSASGHATIVTLPGSGLQVRQYTIQPHQLPIDDAFKDSRFAGDLSYSKLWDPDTHLTFGVSGSKEFDYRSFSANSGISRDFNDHNTTLSFSANLEYDQSRPYYGTPTPLTEMNGVAKGPSDSKTVLSLVGGVTQVINRYWLLQLNYNIGWNKGYQTDPYRIISVVDSQTGEPLQYLYENRPRSRTRQSVYLANKIALGPTVADLSFRYYHDSWKINSITAEFSERVPITSDFYIEPEYRYYHQTAASFFDNFLLSGTPLPEFASSDSRLGRFNATTIGLKFGFSVGDKGEVYVLAEDYRQKAAGSVAGAPGDLANETLFSGVHAHSVMAGFSYTFR